jgi:hypothetical protein
MKTTTRAAAAGLVAGALLLAGCGSSDSTSSSDTTAAKKTTTTVAAELEITDAWARQSPMGTTAGAVYLTITSPVDDALVGASVPTSVAATTEIHETVAADDSKMSSTTEAMGGDTEMTTTTAMGDSTETTMAEGSESMTMQPVDSIELPAGEAVELKPGGYHIMLLDLVKPLEVGQSIDVTLTFDKAGEKTVTAEVREG